MLSEYTGGVRNRRKRALSRLETQLSNRKRPQVGKKLTENEQRKLDEFDTTTKRIEKEIETLKSRI